MGIEPKVTYTDNLIVYETDELDPPGLPVAGGGGYAVGPNGEPIQLRRDTRMITTRGYLNKLSKHSPPG